MTNNRYIEFKTNRKAGINFVMNLLRNIRLNDDRPPTFPFGFVLCSSNLIFGVEWDSITNYLYRNCDDGSKIVSHFKAMKYTTDDLFEWTGVGMDYKDALQMWIEFGSITEDDARIIIQIIERECVDQTQKIFIQM